MKTRTQSGLLLTLVLSITGCGLVGIYCLVAGRFGRLEERILVTTALFAASAILGLASALVWERKRWQPIGPVGIAAAAMALVFVLPLVWVDRAAWGATLPTRRFLEKAGGVAWVWAVALPLIGLTALARLERAYLLVRTATVEAAVLLAALASYEIVWGPVRIYERAFGVLGILCACGFIALPILDRVSMLHKREAARSVELKLSLICPRCSTTQVLPVGRSRCAKCRLLINVEIEEELCPGCGYFLCGLVGIYCLVAGLFGPLEERILVTTVLFVASAILGLASALVWERKRWQPIGPVGLAAAAMALVFVLPLVWVDHAAWGATLPTRRFLEKGGGAAWVWAVALPLIGLTALARLERGYRWVRTATIVATVLLAALETFEILGGHFRINECAFGVLGVLCACGFIALPILDRVSMLHKREAARSVELKLSLTCPRCSTTQVLPVGRSRCAKCRLLINVEIEEDLCPRCGYSLYRLESAACPECGLALTDSLAGAPHPETHSA
ncbi:MAG: hypothetical protein HY763_06630 [Planctomycetes bacterium]|nr:hypothetical protein [Planctomycetota bacterium]